MDFPAWKTATDGALLVQRFVSHLGDDADGAHLQGDAAEFVVRFLDKVPLPVALKVSKSWQFSVCGHTVMQTIDTVSSPVLIVDVHATVAEMFVARKTDMRDDPACALHAHNGLELRADAFAPNWLTETTEPASEWFVATTHSGVHETLLTPDSMVLSIRHATYWAVAMCVHTGCQGGGHYTCVRATSIHPDRTVCHVFNDAAITSVEAATPFDAFSASAGGGGVAVVILYKRVCGAWYEGPMTPGIANMSNTCYANAAVQLLAPIALAAG